MRPARTPIGLVLSRAARVVSRAFDEALADAAGSLPMWLVVLNLKTGRAANQRELAESIGVSEATLTIASTLWRRAACSPAAVTPRTGASTWSS